MQMHILWDISATLIVPHHYFPEEEFTVPVLEARAIKWLRFILIPAKRNTNIQDSPDCSLSPLSSLTEAAGETGLCLAPKSSTWATQRSPWVWAQGSCNVESDEHSLCLPGLHRHCQRNKRGSEFDFSGMETLTTTDPVPWTGGWRGDRGAWPSL